MSVAHSIKHPEVSWMHPFCLEHLRSLIWGIIVPFVFLLLLKQQRANCFKAELTETGFELIGVWKHTEIVFYGNTIIYDPNIETWDFNFLRSARAQSKRKAVENHWEPRRSVYHCYYISFFNVTGQNGLIAATYEEDSKMTWHDVLIIDHFRRLTSLPLLVFTSSECHVLRTACNNVLLKLCVQWHPRVWFKVTLMGCHGFGSECSHLTAQRALHYLSFPFLPSLVCLLHKGLSQWEKSSGNKVGKYYVRVSARNKYLCQAEDAREKELLLFTHVNGIWRKTLFSTIWILWFS